MSWTGDGHAAGLWWATVTALLALLAASIVSYAVDRRVLDGESIWAKPIRFELALALHFATLALVVGRLGEPWRWGTFLRWIALASIACTAFEMAYIVAQAARQKASHFNLATPLLTFLYALMAAGAVVITLSAAAVGVAAIMDPDADLGPATRAGVAIGLIIGAILTLVVAFRMGGALAHHVGREPPGAPRMPLAGWSLSVGDRRAPHFFATHLMQAGPLAGVAADRVLSRGPAIIAVVAVCLAWIALTLLLFRQANAGDPIIRWRP
jgi:hypothetical protein